MVKVVDILRRTFRLQHGSEQSSEPTTAHLASSHTQNLCEVMEPPVALKIKVTHSSVCLFLRKSKNSFGLLNCHGSHTLVLWILILLRSIAKKWVDCNFVLNNLSGPQAKVKDQDPVFYVIQP
jgi:hypothetical protein